MSGPKLGLITFLSIVGVVMLLMMAAACGDGDDLDVAGGGSGGDSTAATQDGDDADDDDNGDMSEGPVDDDDGEPGPGMTDDGDGDSDGEPSDDDGDSPDDDGNGESPTGAPGEPDLGEGGPEVDVCALLTPGQVLSFLKQSATPANDDAEPPHYGCFWQAETGEGVAVSVTSTAGSQDARDYFSYLLGVRTGAEQIAGVEDGAYWRPINGELGILYGSHVIQVLPQVSLTTYPEGEGLMEAAVQLGQMVVATLEELN